MLGFLDCITNVTIYTLDFVLQRSLISYDL
jgi:hypothetical protein